jgi:hypothetical protein
MPALRLLIENVNTFGCVSNEHSLSYGIQVIRLGAPEIGSENRLTPLSQPVSEPPGSPAEQNRL